MPQKAKRWSLTLSAIFASFATRELLLMTPYSSRTEIRSGDRCLSSPSSRHYHMARRRPNQFDAVPTADSSSRNALSFSPARTMKRFPSPCASTIQIVLPSTSIAKNPALTPTGFAEVVSDDFPVFHGSAALLIVQNRLRLGLTHLKLCAHFL